MTNRVTYAPQDVQKMCKQAERDHENRKLIVLMERVKRQIAARESARMDAEPGAKPSVVTMKSESERGRLPSRSVPLER